MYIEEELPRIHSLSKSEFGGAEWFMLVDSIVCSEKPRLDRKIFSEVHTLKLSNDCIEE